MKITMLPILLSLLCSLSTSAEARITDGKVKLTLKDKTLTLKADPGFHLNTNAPAKLLVMPSNKKILPTKKENDEFQFLVKESDLKELALDYYVCDDKLTTCERHKENYAIVDNSLVAQAAVSEKLETPVQTSDSKIILNSHHFIVDALESAQPLAKKEKKLLFVDFSAPWCPACLRLETEVFGQKAFLSQTKNLVKVSLNMDVLVNDKAFEKYGVNVIPTMILMNAEGDELYRMVDFRATKELLKELSLALKNSKDYKSYEQYLILAEAGNPDAIEYLAMKAFNRFDFKNADLWFKKLPKISLYSAAADVGNQAKENANSIAESYKKYIAAYPTSFDSIVWRNELAKLMDQQQKNSANSILQTNIDLIKKALADKKFQKKIFQETAQGFFTSFETEELYSRLMDAYQLKGDTVAEATSLLMLQEKLAKHPLSADRSGEVLIAIDYMKAAKMKKEVGNWYLKLSDKYPESDLYPRKLARFLYQDKQFAQALPIAEKAVNLGNRYLFWDLIILAQVQQELKLPEAKMTADKALAMREAQEESNNSYFLELKKISN